MLRLIAIVGALSLGSVFLGLGLSANLDGPSAVDDAARFEATEEGPDAVDSVRADDSESADESDAEDASEEEYAADDPEADEDEAADQDSGEELAEAGDDTEEEGEGEGGFTMIRGNPPPPDLPQ